MQKHQKELRAKAQKLSPVVIIGQNGLTPSVNTEIDIALNAHELIKIRINADTRDDRQLMIADIIKNHQADLVQQVGHVVSIFRKKPEETH